MRKLTIELRDTEMESTSWGFTILERSIDEHLNRSMKQGKFIGNIKIVIEETKTVIDEEEVELENE